MSFSSTAGATGSTTQYYEYIHSGSYVGNCRLCGHTMYGTQMYSYDGTNIYVECGWCGNVFDSGSGANVNALFRGYMQKMYDVEKRMIIGYTRDWAP